MLQLDKVNLDLEEAFYEDIRSGFHYLAKITRLSKAVKKQYIQALSDFKCYLDENKLNFDKKYLINTGCVLIDDLNLIQFLFNFF